MKIQLSKGLLSFDGTSCHLLQLVLEEKEATPSTEEVRSALFEMDEALRERNEPWGSEARAVVIDMPDSARMPWAPAMAVGKITDGYRGDPRTAVLMLDADVPTATFCIATGDMEHYEDAEFVVGETGEVIAQHDTTRARATAI